MKIRKLLIIALVVALIAVYYILGNDYLKQHRDNETFTSQVTESASMLAQITPPPKDLDDRLSNVLADLDTARNSFPGKLDDTTIIYTILKFADEIGIRAIPLVTQPWIHVSIGGMDYSVFRLNVATSGTFSQLSDFLNKLENGELKTLVMEYLSVDRASASYEEEGSTVNALEIEASLQIAVYTQWPFPVNSDNSD